MTHGFVDESMKNDEYNFDFLFTDAITRSGSITRTSFARAPIGST